MRFQSSKSEMAEVDMTPMIDIVFQLIAFFMVITNFENAKADERVKLPKNVLAKPTEVERTKELVLNIGFERNEKGEVLSGPHVFYASDNIAVDKLGPTLRREKELFQDLGTKPEDVTVVIRADAEVKTGLVQEVIKLAQEDGEFEKFALKATQEINP